MDHPPLQLLQSRDPAVGQAVHELTVALESELRLVHGLRDALVQQRTAVAADHPEAVDASADDIARLLLALRDARHDRGRRQSELLGEGAHWIEAVHEMLGTVPPRLLEAQAGLRRAATDVARETAINRSVLQRVISSGEAFLQALFSAAAPPAPNYLPRREEPTAPASVMLNLEA